MKDPKTNYYKISINIIMSMFGQNKLTKEVKEYILTLA